MNTRRYREPFRVAICFDRAQKYSDQVLKGIIRYVNIHGPWTLFMDPRFFGQYERRWLRNWQGDGILSYVEDRILAGRIIASRMPAVELFGHRFDLGLPQVCPDGKAAGRMAAQHLIERRFRNFAFCGYRGQPWSEHRHDGFVDAIHKAGFSPHIHLVSRPYHSLELGHFIQRQIDEWIRQLPLPVGIMVCSDRHAQRVIAACHAAKICVPDEAAIIGSGNDEEFCHLSRPPLSSVMHDTDQIGYVAAQRLHQMMLGSKKARRPSTTFIPPIGVATRESTDIMAIPDKLIANMVSFIRQRARYGLGVKELLSEFGMSRATCYRRFKTVLNRTPHEEILRVRLERTKELLSQTDFPIEKIAELSGFENTEYLYVAFKRAFGSTPRHFRLQSHFRERNGRELDRVK